MSYPNGCPGAMVIDYFSNPDPAIKYRNQMIGTETENNAKEITMNMVRVQQARVDRCDLSTTKAYVIVISRSADFKC